eukprot:11197086-Lingulodinium_polyedra.AAC.1
MVRLLLDRTLPCKTSARALATTRDCHVREGRRGLRQDHIVGAKPKPQPARLGANNSNLPGDRRRRGLS